MSSHNKVRYIVYIGILSALSIILFMFLEIPLPVSGLKIDASDIPAAIAGVIMGPMAAVIVEFIKILIHLPIKGLADTMGYGDLMNFVVGIALTVPFSIVYRSLAKRGFKDIKALIIAGIVGMVSMTAFGVLGNYFIAPLYFEFFMKMRFTSAVLWGYIGGATILNISKSLLVAVLMIPIMAVVKKQNIKL